MSVEIIELSVLEFFIVNNLKDRFFNEPIHLENYVKAQMKYDKLNMNCLDMFLEDAVKCVRFDLCLHEIRLLQIEQLIRLDKEQCPKK